MKKEKKKEDAEKRSCENDRIKAKKERKSKLIQTSKKNSEN